MCIIAFSHAIFNQRAGDRVGDCDGGMFSHHLGSLALGQEMNEEVRRYSESYLLSAVLHACLE